MATTEQPVGIEKVPLESLQTTTEWAACTLKQQAWLSAYIGNGYNSLTATKCAYEPRSDHNAWLMAYEILANSKVKAVLALHFRQSPLDSFLADLETAIRRSKGIAKIRAMSLYARLKWGVGEGIDCGTVEAPRQHCVGEVIHQGDVDYEVLAMDTNKNVTSVKNLQTGEVENV